MTPPYRRGLSIHPAFQRLPSQTNGVIGHKNSLAMLLEKAARKVFNSVPTDAYLWL